MSQKGQITDTELLDVFEAQGQGLEGLSPEKVAPIMRELVEILWAEPDADTEPGKQLHGELTELTEFLESDEAIHLVAAMQEVLGAYTAGTLPWTEGVSTHMREGAEAIAEELNPDPPRQKLEEAVTSGAEPPLVLAVGLDEDSRAALARALEALSGGASVVTAATAETADTVWQQQAPALAVVDEAIAGDDHALLSRLRHHDHWTPLVLTAESATDDERRQAVAAGANRIFTGPPTAHRLTRALEHLWS
ncbi:hypothetical protein [Thiohalorhabdus sp.]|uniref:hypothetical protein n=1 Tax=Thiohalorhabdus sp. TaxID=3094134 RepID=UPI002FC2B055